MDLIKRIFNTIVNFIIDNIDFSPRGSFVRISIAALVIFFSINVITAYSTSYLQRSEIKYIEKRFAIKEQSLMIAVVADCKGDIGNRDTLVKCIADAKSEMLSESKKKLWVANFKVAFNLFLMLFLVLFIYYLKYKQDRKLNEIYEEDQNAREV